MPPISVSSRQYNENHLTQAKVSARCCRAVDMSPTADMEPSLSASQAPFDFFSTYSRPFLNDSAYASPLSLFHDDSMPSSRVFKDPISAFIAHPLPALSSYSSVLSSETPFRVSAASQCDALIDSQRPSPKSPATSYPLFCHESPTKLSNDIPSFSLEDSPFLTLDITTFPSLLDSGSSPVVRRSQGDVTPLFGRGGEIIHVSTQPKRRCDISRDEHSSDSGSPTLQQRSTPFLQRLRGFEDSLSSSTNINPALPLASPFALKDQSTRAPFAEQLSPTYSTIATHETLGEKKKFTAIAQKLLGLDCSPLSEASSLSPPGSPILSSAMQAIFDEEDQRHRMNTRSRSKAKLYESSQPTSKPSALRTSTTGEKRKYRLQDEIVNDFPTESESDIKIPPFTKRKTHGGVGSLARRTAARRQSTSRGASVTNNSSPADRDPEVDISAPGRLDSILISNSDQSALDLRTSLPYALSPPESQRRFPPTVSINPMFPLFYKQFPLSSFFYPEGSSASIFADISKPPPPAQINHPQDPYDLYTPRFTRGIGKSKLGLCPICFESVNRGGANNAEWLAMKVSAYKEIPSRLELKLYKLLLTCLHLSYHMQYAHGISPATGLPFSPPIAFRTAARPASEIRKQEKTNLLQGKCHKCHKWAAIEGVKTGEVKVKELFWWKHAASCHRSSIIPGEGNVYFHDSVYHRLQQYERKTKPKDNERKTEDDSCV